MLPSTRVMITYEYYCLLSPSCGSLTKQQYLHAIHGLFHRSIL